MLAVIVFCGAVNVFAQKVLTVDTEGNPVAYAHVFDESGNIIGTTDMNGTLDDVKFEQAITVTHVAFKEKKVYVKGEGTVRVVLEDSDYGLGEIVVKPKEYIYVQTYYRIIYMGDDTMRYCRFGIIDNTYDVKKKTISHSHEHASKAMMGLLKTILDGVLGRILDSMGELPTIDQSHGVFGNNLKIIPEADNRYRLCYSDSTLGYAVNDLTDHVRRISIDYEKYRRMEKQKKADDRQRKGKKVKEEKIHKKNAKENTYTVYQIDDEGRFGVEDFVMRQWHDDYDTYSSIDKKDEHIRIWLETYATDREYVTKEELKEKKKANKVKMSYAAIQEFERKHNIPALPVKAQEEITKLFNK